MLVGNLSGVKQLSLAGTVMYTTQLMVSLLLEKRTDHHWVANFQSPQASTPPQDKVNGGSGMIDIYSCEYLVLSVYVELLSESFRGSRESESVYRMS